MDIQPPDSIAISPGGSRTHDERGLSGSGASSPPARDHEARSAFDPTRTAARTSNRAAAPPGTEPRGPCRPRATDRTTPWLRKLEQSQNALPMIGAIAGDVVGSP